LEHKLGRKLVLFHRLDVDTTGLVVFGKDPSINKAMNDLFKTREVEKYYLAVVDGRWDPAWKKVETFIKKIAGGKYVNGGRGSGGDFAHTEFDLIESIGEKSLLRCQLFTGRTHQIRLHTSFHRHPILGDATYGKVDRMGVPIALHARELKFKHPVSGKILHLKAKLPDYWESYWLKGFSQAALKNH
jgi:RluA family pseudouridine synthase